MAIKITASPKVKHRERTPLASIPADVKTAVEEGLVYCAENPDHALTAEFDTQEEAVEFLHDARSYAFLRDPKVTVSGNASKNGNARFTVAAKLEA